MYSNYDYNSIENAINCKLGNYSDNFIYAFFERIQCGDYSQLIVFLLFTIILTLFVMMLSKNEKN